MLNRKTRLIGTLLVLIFLSTLAPTIYAAPDFGGQDAFRHRWLVQDGLVGGAGINRPYTWGPNIPGAATSLTESYQNSPGGQRRVLYLDKARMEINDPTTGFVTTGLVVKELVSGLRQDGDNAFSRLAPSKTQVAGDAVAVNPDTPVYASFRNLVTLGNTDGHSVPANLNQPINTFVAKNGTLSLIAPPETITTSAYDAVTGHNIARPFQDFKYQRGPVTDPLSGATVQDQPVYTSDPTSNVFGYAISEPYWLSTRIAEQPQTVLVQLFERRVLTYNPALSGNRVEMGNLGQHYYSWRYLENNPSPTNPVNPVAPSVPTSTDPWPTNWLARLNAYRAATGLAAVSEDVALSNADGKHVNYMLLNPDDFRHDEDSTRPGYTQEGQTAAKQSNLFGGNGRRYTEANAIDAWIESPFHRFGMLNPKLNRSGFRLDCNDQHCFAALNVIAGTSGAGSGNNGTIYPGNSQTNVNTRLVSWQFGPFEPTMQLVSASWRDAAGNNVGFKVENAVSYFNIVSLRADAALAVNTTYGVDMTVMENGQTYQRHWIFSTGSSLKVQ